MFNAFFRKIQEGFRRNHVVDEPSNFTELKEETEFKEIAEHKAISEQNERAEFNKSHGFNQPNKRHKPNKNAITVLHVSMEYGMPCDPESIGVGGIGSVVSSLCLAQQHYPETIDARVIIPFYDGLQREGQHQAISCAINHFYDGRDVSSLILKTITNEGIIQYYVKPLGPPYNQLFSDIWDPSMIYADNATHSRLIERMAYFTSAVSTFACRGEPDFKPSIIQGHGWALAFLGKLIRKQRLLNLSKIPYTIYVNHSVHEQDGVFQKNEVPDIGLTWNRHVIITQEILENGYDHIVYVSEPLLRESISHPSHDRIAKLVYEAYKAHKTTVILNNVSAARFDPSHCLEDDFKFDLNAISSGKTKVKIHLNHTILSDRGKRINLDAPMLLFVGRYSEEKGIKIFDRAIQLLLKNQGTFFAMGIGEPPIIQSLIEKYQYEPSVIFFTTQEEQARYGALVRAAADMYLVPSMIESCGLVPMEAGISGAIVLAHQTTGLLNTVTPDANGAHFIYGENNETDGNGKHFEDVCQKVIDNFEELKQTGNLDMALHLIQKSATMTFDWHSPTVGSVSPYFALYQSLTGNGDIQNPSRIPAHALVPNNSISLWWPHQRKNEYASTLHTYISEGTTKEFYEFVKQLTNVSNIYAKSVINFNFVNPIPPLYYTAIHAAAVYADQNGDFEILVQLITLGGSTSWYKKTRANYGYTGRVLDDEVDTIDNVLGPKMCAGIRTLIAESLDNQIVEIGQDRIGTDATTLIVEYCGEDSVSTLMKHIGIANTIYHLQKLHNEITHRAVNMQP